MIEFEPLLDDIQAAGLLGVHPKTLQRLARAGDSQTQQDTESTTRSGAITHRHKPFKESSYGLKEQFEKSRYARLRQAMVVLRGAYR